MPELPEVETVKRIIEPQIKGKRIAAVTVHHPQVIASPDVETFIGLATGRTVTGMGRRGKFLALHLDNGDRIWLHLRMTGQLLVTPADWALAKHTHLIMDLSDENSDEKQIRFIDVRRFGRFWYLQNDEELIGHLGIEPGDRRLNAAYLRDLMGKRKKAIKEMLLDQSLIAGIGNLYSDEILYAAGIHPERRGIDLLEDDWQRLATEIPRIIDWAIRANRMTAEEYLAGEGKAYRNLPELKIYGHAGMPCGRCECLFQKIAVGGRSSVYCPECQKIAEQA